MWGKQTNKPKWRLYCTYYGCRWARARLFIYLFIFLTPPPTASTTVKRCARAGLPFAQQWCCDVRDFLPNPGIVRELFVSLLCQKYKVSISFYDLFLFLRANHPALCSLKLLILLKDQKKKKKNQREKCEQILLSFLPSFPFFAPCARASGTRRHCCNHFPMRETQLGLRVTFHSIAQLS